jgi:hypothetical protein
MKECLSELAVWDIVGLQGSEHPLQGLAVYNKLAVTSRTADAVIRTGQILNQMTGVRAPVRLVSTASASSSPAAAR